MHHPWSIDAERARDIALACEAAALEADPRIRNSEGATLATHDNTRVLGNTFGVITSYSIHYTKLYDGDLAPGNRSGGDPPAGGGGGKPPPGVV